jgi:hypothetical protein
MKIIDIFECEDLKLSNPTNEEANEHFTPYGGIIGVLKGSHFKPAGISKNGRYYPEDDRHGRLWETQLKRKDLQETMNNHLMYGCIGHSNESSDELLASGKASHFTKNLKIIPTGDPKSPYQGYAESYILNTEAGRNLKTYLEAGMKLAMSTRAEGDIIPGQFHKVNENGSFRDLPILDPSKYRLERVDVVSFAGFPDCKPTYSAKIEMAESVTNENNLPDNPIEESNTMSTQNENTNALIQKHAGDVVIQVTADNQISLSKAQSTPSTAQFTNAPHDKSGTATDAVDANGAGEVTYSQKSGAANTITEDKETVAENVIVSLMNVIDEQKAKIKELEEAVSAVAENVASDPTPDLNKMSAQQVADWKKGMVTPGVANPEENVAALKANVNEEGLPADAGELLAAAEKFFEEVGDPDMIIAKLVRLHEMETEFGSAAEIREAINLMNTFVSKVGSIDQVTAMLEEAVDFHHKIGSQAEIVSICKLLEEFCKKFGSIESASAAIENSTKFFHECGAPEVIREKLRVAAAYESLGITDINEIKSILEELKTKKFENYALKISKDTGLNYDRVVQYLNEGYTHTDIVRIYNEASSVYDKLLTVNESVDVNSMPLRAIDQDGDSFTLDNVKLTVGNSYTQNESDNRLNRVLNKFSAELPKASK